MQEQCKGSLKRMAADVIRNLCTRKSGFKRILMYIEPFPAVHILSQETFLVSRYFR